MTSADESGYIKTATHNYVSRQAVVSNPSKVELKGKSILQPGVKIRGDLAIVRMGRYCFVGNETTLSPAPLGDDKYVHMILRGNVVIGNHCNIQAGAIGTNVYIGNNVTLGERCIIKDSCWIEDGTSLGKDTVIPPFSRVAGAPGKVIEELPPSASLELQELAQSRYQEFVASNPDT